MTDSTDDDSKPSESSTLRRLLEVGVFAPLGFVLEYRSVLPKLTEAGRRQVDFTRSLGRAALRTIARGRASYGSPNAGGTGRAIPASVTAAPPALPPLDAESPADHAPPVVAVAGYSDMTARQVIALLGDAEPGQVEWIEKTETAGKGRVTVLRAATARRARLQRDS